MTARTPTVEPDRTTTGRTDTLARDAALVAAFATLISASAYVGAVPVGSAGVPITLQTLTVMLAGCILGPVRGFAAATLYLALGAVGLPVFAGHAAGIGEFSGPTAGYLVSFPLAAALGGLLMKYVAGRRRTRAIVGFLCAIVPTALLIHGLGILGLQNFLDVTFREAAVIDAPYWLGDVLKAAFTGIIAAEVHRAFPRLLARD